MLRTLDKNKIIVVNLSGRGDKDAEIILHKDGDEMNRANPFFNRQDHLEDTHMTGRIERKFRDLKQKKEKALVVYLTAGDPDLETTRRLVLALEEAGVDIIEIGVPFSDPTADGPVIQAASQRALRRE